VACGEISVPTARERAISTTPATTAASAITTAPPPSGVSPQLSPPTTGASRTGSTVCALNTSGATWLAGRTWNALFSLRTPTIAAASTRSAHSQAVKIAPSFRSSDTSLVTKPLSANATPALTIAA